MSIKLPRFRVYFFYAREKWAVLVILGGVANFLAVRTFQVFYQYVTSWPFLIGAGLPVPITTEYIIRFSIIPGVLLFLFPIFLSGTLTQLVPEKIIVPPLYIQMITLAGIILSLANASISDAAPTLLLGLAYTTIGGVVQDRTTSVLFGMSSNRDDIITSTIEVTNASPDDLVRILSTPKFADNLNLTPHAEKLDGNCFIFRNVRGAVYETRIEIKKIPYGESTIINTAFFENARYYLRYSNELFEYGRAIHVYLFDLLSRSASSVYPDVKLIVQQPTEKYADPLIDSIIDETQGWWIQTKKLTKFGWVKVALFIFALAIIGVFLFVLKDYPSGYATLALVILYTVFELPSRIRRRYKQ